MACHRDIDAEMRRRNIVPPPIDLDAVVPIFDDSGLGLPRDCCTQYEQEVRKAALQLSHMRCSLQARLMLLDRSSRIRQVTRQEWIGLNVLERDGEL